MPNLESEYILSRFKEPKLLSDNGETKVYMVLDNTTNRPYIQKEFPKGANMDIYRQMQSLAPNNIPKIHHIIEGDTHNCIIEEYISGTRLDEIVGNRGKLDTNQVTMWVLSLCDTLKQLHDAHPPIIHRDIKPSNIIITDDNTPKLIDFNISRNYKSDGGTDTRLLGTEYYAAPEQFGFAQTDRRTDIYAIGKLMTVLLTGKQHKPDDKLNNCGQLKSVIERCCSIDPANRYQSVSELKKELLQSNNKSLKNMIIALSCMIILISGLLLVTQFAAPVSDLTSIDGELSEIEKTITNGQSSVTKKDNDTGELSKTQLDEIDFEKYSLISIMPQIRGFNDGSSTLDIDVYIDNVYVGSSEEMYFEIWLEDGEYEISCRKDGYTNYDFTGKIDKALYYEENPDVDKNKPRIYYFYPYIAKESKEQELTAPTETDANELTQKSEAAPIEDSKSTIPVINTTEFIPYVPEVSDNERYNHLVGFYTYLKNSEMPQVTGDIYINGTYVGATDDIWGSGNYSLDVLMEAGIYKVTCKAEGYQDYEFYIKLYEYNGPYEQHGFSINLNDSSIIRPENPTMIFITSDPSEADVFIGDYNGDFGYYYGQTPLVVLVDIDNIDEFELRKEGYQSKRSGRTWKREIAGEENKLHFNLLPE